VKSGNVFLTRQTSLSVSNKEAIPLQPMNPIDQSNRIFFLDLLKAVSISIVVFYHSLFLPINTYFSVAIAELIIHSPLRFCVPVFLTISFFLLERELSTSKEISPWLICRKRLIRLAIPTGFWFGLAALLTFAKGNSLQEVFATILMGDIYIGAYFLLVLLQLIPIFILIRRSFQKTRNILIIVGLQIAVFVTLKVLVFYGGSFGYDAINILSNIGRPLIAYWFIYMPLGYFLYHRHSQLLELSSSLEFKHKMGGFLVVSFLLLLEYANLIPNIGNYFYVFEFALITCIISTLVVFVCTFSIQSNQLPLKLVSLIYLLSRYSLGIFCINGILSKVFSLLGRAVLKEMTFSLPEVLAARLIGWVILLSISLVLAIQMDRFGFKALVR